MSSNQFITPSATNQSATSAVIGQLGQTSEIVPMTFEPKISVRCDLCEENAYNTIFSLDQQGWGIYDTFEFCPRHEAMI